MSYFSPLNIAIKWAAHAHVSARAHARAHTHIQNVSYLYVHRHGVFCSTRAHLFLSSLVEELHFHYRLPSSDAVDATLNPEMMIASPIRNVTHFFHLFFILLLLLLFFLSAPPTSHQYHSITTVAPIDRHTFNRHILPTDSTALANSNVFRNAPNKSAALFLGQRR